jgi:hypothetical protein
VERAFLGAGLGAPGLVVWALFEGEKPSTVLMVLGIVAFMVGMCVFVIVLGLTQEARTRRLIRSSSEPPDAPDPDGPVRRYRGANGAPPPEVEALGEPEHVHSPGQLCSLACRPTYTSYADALVMTLEGQYTVIPWDAITEYLHGWGFGVSTGQRFHLDSGYTDFCYLHGRIRDEIMGRVLPEALDRIRAGGDVVFRPFEPRESNWNALLEWFTPAFIAPFSVSAKTISYNGRTLFWPDVTGIKLTHYQQYGVTVHTELTIQERGAELFNWCRIRLNMVPNDAVFLEVIRRFCPPHLLASAGSALRW